MRMPRRFASIVLYAAVLCGLADGAAAGAVLKSGPVWLIADVGRAIEFRSGADPWAKVSIPLSADVVDGAGRISRLVGLYSGVRTSDGSDLICEGELTDADGSTLDFVDIYGAGAQAGTFQIRRRVTVGKIGGADKGFRTQIAVSSMGSSANSDVDVFVPGNWYCDAAHVPISGLIGDPKQRNYLFREDRLPLPLAMLRERSSGLCIELIHAKPDGATFVQEYTSDPVIDERMQFASLGLSRDQTLAVELDYPGVEADQTRMGDGRRTDHPAQRFHPIRSGIVQDYQALIRISRQNQFSDAMRQSWRDAFDAMSVEVVPVPMDRVYQASIDLLDHYGNVYNGTPGFPFNVLLPSGKIRHVSMQMGFVGEQIPCACHLITAGLSQARPALVQKGEAIVDFWARNCLTPEGLPRTWFDVEPQPHWRNYKTYTRIATDGMEGMLQAWRREQLAHRPQPRWLDCCQAFGQWLLNHQNPDGSFCRQYDFDGSILIPSKSASLHPVRFLVDLSNATDDGRYLDAARRAGGFAVSDIGPNANYYGGTADNADVKDKEAGWIAMDSFLSLYDATADRRWLDAARGAADYTETWTYCWNVPIPRDDPRVSLPPMKTTAGMGLIATGHSSADGFLAFAPFAYYRLAILTDDAHYAQMARILLYDTRQLVDYDGAWHYGQPGLLTEATTLAAPRGRGVSAWLPWCTAAILDPMVQFQDVFDSMDLDKIGNLPLDVRRSKLAAYALHHGFPSIGLPASR